MADYIDGLVLPTSAKLKRTAYTDADTSRLRELAAAHAFDDDAVSDAVFFPVVASANTIDSYGTFMLPNTLQNFAEDASRGVAVLDSHMNHRLNFGMSVTGQYVEDGEVRAMTSDFYTVPGVQTEGLNTDAYIRGVRAGLFRDVSVGFWMPPGARIACTICGGDMMRWWSDDGCANHFPGVEYTVESDGEKRTETAYGAVDGARLSEYSLVYDGATPGAGVVKARSMEDDGMLPPEVALQLERAYHTTFPRATRIYQGWTAKEGNTVTGKDKERKPGDGQEDNLPEDEATTPVVPDVVDDDAGDDEERTTITSVDATNDDEQEPAGVTTEGDEDEDLQGDDAIERSRAVMSKGLRTALNEKYAEHGITFGVRTADAVTTLADALVQARKQLQDANNAMQAMERDAADGKAYRASVVQSLKDEVIRAANAGEDKQAKAERYARLAETVDIETVVEMRDDFASIARAKYGKGRKTVEGDDKPGARVSHDNSVYDDV